MWNILKRKKEVSETRSAVDQDTIAELISTIVGNDVPISLRDQYDKGLKESPAVYRGVNILCTVLSSVPLTVTGSDGNVIENHPLLKLFRHPNDVQSRTEFITRTISNYALNGNAYIMRVKGVGKIVELWAIDPDRVTPDETADIFNPVRKWTVNSGPKLIDVPVGDMAHIHTPQMPGETDGISPLACISLPLAHQSEARKWNKSLLSNSAKPSVAITTPKKISKLEFDEFKRRVQSSQSGTRNAGSIMVLDDGKTVVPIGMTALEMDFTQGMIQAGRDISLGIGVPSEVLGDSTNKTYSNFQEAMRSLIDHTAVPLMSMICEGLNRLIYDVYPDVEVGYDKGAMDALKGDNSTLMTALTGAWYMTTNERRAMLGLPAVDDPEADIILAPMGNVPLGMTNPEPVPEGEESDGEL